MVQPYPIPVYGTDPGFDWTPVESVGAVALAIEAEGWPGVVGRSTLYVGPIDIAALQESWSEALAARPTLTSLAAVVGPLTAQRLVWRHTQDRPEIEVVDRRADGVPDGEPDEWLADIDLHADPWFPDLTIEHPIRMRITSLSGDHHVLTRWGHHMAGDGSFYLVLERDLLARYHEKVTGVAPAWAQTPGLLAETTKAPGEPSAANGWLGYMRDEWLEGQVARREGVGQIAGTPGEPAPLVASRRIPDADVIKALRDKARSLGGTLTDLGLVASTVAVAEWNEAVGTPVTFQRQSVPVNLRGRLDDIDEMTGNVGTLYQVSSHAAEWGDPNALVSAMASARKSFVEGGHYLQALKALDFIRRMILPLPIRRRFKLISALNSPRTLVLSNLGIAFPEIIDGRYTGRAVMQEVGGAQIAASIGHANPNPSCPNALALTTRHDGFHLELSGNGARSTREELSQVAELIEAKFLDFAD